MERKAAAVVSEQALEGVARADRRRVLARREIAGGAGGSSRQAGADHGAGQEFVAARGHPPDGRRVPGAADGRKKSPAYEIRWLNLCGFCLRPGFGYPGDDFRIEQARRVYAGGLTYGNQVQCEIDWWIFWGRVAGGLNRNQQADVYQRLSGFLLPRGNKKPQRDQRVAAARDVAHGVQPGAAAAGHQDRAGRCAGEARQGRRLQRERAVVPLAAGRAQAVLRADQPGGAAGHG